MKALLIIFLWNSGELAITSTPLPNIATCKAVKAQVEETLNKNKYLKGMNRQAVAECFEVSR